MFIPSLSKKTYIISTLLEDFFENYEASLDKGTKVMQRQIKNMKAST